MWSTTFDALCGPGKYVVPTQSTLGIQRVAPHEDNISWSH
jgi:hypothetical protein